MAKVLIIGMEQTEEAELIVTADILRRAGVEVIIANFEDEKSFKCCQKTTIEADAMFKDVEGDIFDAVVIPGGPDYEEFFKEHSKNERLIKFLKKHEKAGKLLAAICSAPVVFCRNNIGSGGRMTCYPGDKDEIEKAGYIYEDMDVVVSNNVVTSRAPGTAFDFAFKLVELLVDKSTSTGLAKKLLYVQ